MFQFFSTRFYIVLNIDEMIEKKNMKILFPRFYANLNEISRKNNTKGRYLRSSIAPHDRFKCFKFLLFTSYFILFFCNI